MVRTEDVRLLKDAGAAQGNLNDGVTSMAAVVTLASPLAGRYVALLSTIKLAAAGAGGSLKSMALAVKATATALLSPAIIGAVAVYLAITAALKAYNAELKVQREALRKVNDERQREINLADAAAGKAKAGVGPEREDIAEQLSKAGRLEGPDQVTRIREIATEVAKQQAVTYAEARDQTMKAALAGNLQSAAQISGQVALLREAGGQFPDLSGMGTPTQQAQIQQRILAGWEQDEGRRAQADEATRIRQGTALGARGRREAGEAEGRAEAEHPWVTVAREELQKARKGLIKTEAEQADLGMWERNVPLDIGANKWESKSDKLQRNIEQQEAMIATREATLQRTQEQARQERREPQTVVNMNNTHLYQNAGSLGPNSPMPSQLRGP